MKHTALTRGEGSKPLVPVLSEHKTWVVDGRFTRWDEAKATEHAFPHPPPPVTTLYEKFGEECAVRGIVPTYHLFEHWMESDGIQPLSARRN